MPESAAVKIASGPDRGKTFDLSEELVHIGSGERNQIVLQDESIEDHHASIVLRNGRYAIYSPLDGVVDVDGTPLPSEQWVWLPQSAKIHLTQSTSILFSSPQKDKQKETDPESTPVNSKRSKNPEDSVRIRRSKMNAQEKSSQSGIRKKKSSRQKAAKSSDAKVAQFITNNSGEALVQLGEDGQLPELALTEGAEKKAKPKQEKKANPALLYVVLFVSFASSLLLLFLEFDIDVSSKAEIRKARQELKKFYGEEGQELRPYQEKLRAAQLDRARKAYRLERRHYRQVLHMLNSEDKNPMTGLTGQGPAVDDELRDLLSILLTQKR